MRYSTEKAFSHTLECFFKIDFDLETDERMKRAKEGARKRAESLFRFAKELLYVFGFGHSLTALCLYIRSKIRWSRASRAFRYVRLHFVGCWVSVPMNWWWAIMAAHTHTPVHTQSIEPNFSHLVQAFWANPRQVTANKRISVSVSKPQVRSEVKFAFLNKYFPVASTKGIAMLDGLGSSRPIYVPSERIIQKTCEAY